MMSVEIPHPGMTERIFATLSRYHSRVYLRRIFRQEMGESPRRYINSMRLRHAASLITSGYYSVGEAARQAGYTDEKYFSVAFRRAMGCPPSQYSYQYKE